MISRTRSKIGSGGDALPASQSARSCGCTPSASASASRLRLMASARLRRRAAVCASGRSFPTERSYRLLRLRRAGLAERLLGSARPQARSVGNALLDRRLEIKLMTHELRQREDELQAINGDTLGMLLDGKLQLLLDLQEPRLQFRRHWRHHDDPMRRSRVPASPSASPARNSALRSASARM